MCVMPSAASCDLLCATPEPDTCTNSLTRLQEAAGSVDRRDTVSYAACGTLDAEDVSIDRPGRDLRRPAPAPPNPVWRTPGDDDGGAGSLKPPSLALPMLPPAPTPPPSNVSSIGRPSNAGRRPDPGDGRAMMPSGSSSSDEPPDGIDPGRSGDGDVLRGLLSWRRLRVSSLTSASVGSLKSSAPARSESAPGRPARPSPRRLPAEPPPAPPAAPPLPKPAAGACRSPLDCEGDGPRRHGAAPTPPAPPRDRDGRASWSRDACGLFSRPRLASGRSREPDDAVPRPLPLV
mmetsp:Transcript_12600/g.44113  ORF Transcript_12600/g.44113 Transcript_12600/m.44113 type:complete len:290 (-) Transcript_12600:259-1128(-)